MTRSSYLNWRVKTFYGLGAAAEAIKNFGFGTLLLLYYNQVLGLSGTYSGIAVFIAIAFDAISDPAVGSWSDGLRHRLGRRHPFMYFGAVPLGITYYLLFWPPLGLTEFQLFLWLTTFAVLSRTALTFFHVPYLSLGAEMSQDYHERSEIVAIRHAFGMIGALVVIATAWNFFFIKSDENPSPQLVRDSYFHYALLSAGLMTAMMLISTWGSQRLVPHLPQVTKEHPPFSFKQVYVDIYDALQNRSFAALFWGSLIFAITAGIVTALSMHALTFFWEIGSNGIEYTQYGGVAGGLVGIALTPWLNRLVDKRMTLIIGVEIFAVVVSVPPLLKLAGVVAVDSPIVLPMLVAAAFLTFVAMIFANVSAMSMMGDLSDEHEVLHRKRQEGVYFGSHSFGMKATGAVGNLVAGFALDLISFPVNSKPGEVPDTVLFEFGLLYPGLVILIGIALWVFWPYSMSSARHARIVEELSERRVSSMHTDHPFVFHLVQASLWEETIESGGVYYPPTYDIDGFTHGTANPEKLLAVANHFYPDVEGDWYCLRMTVESLEATGVSTVYEGTAPVGDIQPDFEGSGDELFPHIHGGIAPGAVLEKHLVLRDETGTFLSIDSVTG